METVGPVVAVAAGAAGAVASPAAAAFVTWGVVASASVASPPAFVVGRAASGALIVAGQIVGVQAVRSVMWTSLYLAL